jgi:hypothetical protein
MSDWVIIYQDGSRSRAQPSREVALSLAVDHTLRQHMEVARIEGPNGEVIDREEIDRWGKDNPPV